MYVHKRTDFTSDFSARSVVMSIRKCAWTLSQQFYQFNEFCEPRTVIHTKGKYISVSSFDVYSLVSKCLDAETYICMQPCQCEIVAFFFTTFSVWCIVLTGLIIISPMSNMQSFGTSIGFATHVQLQLSSIAVKHGKRIRSLMLFSSAFSYWYLLQIRLCS